MKTSGGGVEVEVRMKWSWSWSGVVENACGGGVEVEVEIQILGTLVCTKYIWNDVSNQFFHKLIKSRIIERQRVYNERYSLFGSSSQHFET